MRLLPELRRSELWTYFGPAFVASVAYIDPGNFATNIDGGTRFGYKLLWVLLWSNADGDPDPVPLGQARHCDRAHAAAELPRSLLAAHDDLSLDRGRDLRHRHRSRRVSRCRAGLLSALRSGAAGARIVEDECSALCRAAYIGCGLPDPCARPRRLPLSRVGHHGLRRHHRRLLCDRGLPGASGLEARRMAHHHAVHRPGKPLHRRRHAGRNRDAARDLSALRAGAAAAERSGDGEVTTQRLRAPLPEVRTAGCLCRDERRMAHQLCHDHDGCGRLRLTGGHPRHGARRQHRRRASPRSARCWATSPRSSSP